MPRNYDAADMSELEGEFELEMEDDETSWESSTDRGRELESFSSFRETGDEEFEDLDREGSGYAERLYQLSLREFESESELDSEINQVLQEIEQEFFLGNIRKKWNRFKKTGLGRLVNKGLRVAGGQIPALQALKGVTSLARGDLKGLLASVVKTGISSAIPGGGVALTALKNLGFQEGEATEDNREAWENVVDVAREAYEHLANNLNERADDALEASRLAADAFRAGMRRSGRSSAPMPGRIPEPAGADGAFACAAATFWSSSANRQRPLGARMPLSHSFEARVESARLRIGDLSSLRAHVALSSERDITRRQWHAIELQLSATEARLQSRLKRAADQYLGRAGDIRIARRLNAVLGEIELDLSRSFTFFDTYMDVLSQRHLDALGSPLAGCDVLAWHAIKRDHPALRIVEPPLVFCDRGFGASIIRESVLLPDGTPNPVPLIQIPYARLREKCNLTSIFHEAGHQALVRLGLVTTLPVVLRAALTRARASDAIADLFALWTSEIGPDLWTFSASGLAAAAGIREVLALPPNHVFRISWTDPHPPPYLRVLLAFECCRQEWGRGPWESWETEWKALYPLDGVSAESRKLLAEGVRCIPVIAHALLTTRFRALNGRTIPELFDLRALAPSALEQRAATAREGGALRLSGLSPGVQLAVFRVVKEHGRYPESVLDRVMTQWLIQLGRRRPYLH